MSNRSIITLITLVCLLSASSARAHDPSKSYLSLTLDGGQLIGQWDIPLRDLQNVLSPRLDSNGSVERQQLAARHRDITGYLQSHAQFFLDGHSVVPRWAAQQPALEELSDGQYLRLNFSLEQSPPPRTLRINYQLFFETNSLHRGLLRLEAGGKTQVAAFSPDRSSQLFQFAAPSTGEQFFVFLREGVWHIWTGYDHILFLVALLLPAVLQREAGGWRGVGALRPAFLNVLKIVTAFTIAHSLTLSLASLGVVKLPSRLTESAIALSVVLAAANNLWPLVRERGWIVAFAFGLVHGFGFATALSDLGVTRNALALTLIGFNLGVEAGQLAIVAAFLPVAFALRQTWFYQRPLLRLGSSCIILVAGAWCAERVLGLKFMPF